MLNVEFTKDEIAFVVHQLGAWKVPGPDGLLIGLNLDNWELVGNFVIETVLGMISSRLNIEHYNYNDIVLIPKGQNQTSPADY